MDYTLNFKIEDTQVLPSGNNPDQLIIIGRGSDNWMYQFLGEDGVWMRLSKKYPGSIMLPGVAEAPINSITNNPMSEDAKPEVAEDVVAPEPMVVEVPPPDAPAAAE